MYMYIKAAGMHEWRAEFNVDMAALTPRFLLVHFDGSKTEDGETCLGPLENDLKTDC